MNRSERRSHVRLKPLPELPAHVALLDGDAAPAPVDVVDVGVGGIALAARDRLAAARVGERHHIRLALGRYGEYACDVEVRWVSAATIGLAFVTPEPTLTRNVGRYVAELLERGAPS